MRKLLAFLLTLLMCLSALPAALGEESATPLLGVTYEIFVGSFQDSNGDGHGDLQGIIDRLDYIESLGVKQIWLMPIHPSPSYHKYDVTDYYAIDATYGTLDDFDRLVAACKERGISIILDLVLNHSSSAHPAFLAACDDKFFSRTGDTTDWYVFYEEEGNARHKISGCSWWYEGQFGSHMPDYNLDSESLREEFARIITFWQSHGIAGFRLDAVTSYYTGATASTASFLRFLSDTAKANDPNCYLVGEAWTDESTMLSLYESQVDSLFNFPASDSTGRFVKAALNAKGAALASAQAEWNEKLRAVSPASVDAPFLSNHDMARARGMLRSKVANEKAGALSYLLMPGVPTVYYGEELGMSGSGRDENKRLPMVWSGDTATWCTAPADADQEQRLKEGVAEQDSDPDSLLNCYRQLIALRNKAPELTRGTMTALDGGNDAICFYTVTDVDSTVAVAINLSQKDTLLVSLSDFSDFDLLGTYGDASIQDAAAQLPPLSCVLLRLK